MTGRQIPAPSFHPEMWKALVEGRKWKTSRSKKLGEAGDTFTVDGVTFRIVEVREEAFGAIARSHYQGEGFSSSGEFVDFWIRIHRGHLPDPGAMKWLHILEKVAG
jgi:hypothetical protein